MLYNAQSIFLDPSSQGTAFVFEAKPAITLNILPLQTNVCKAVCQALE
ncbi:hypothetical protein [Wolbachia endosymbiont (group A) of Epistrophe grossularia]|nr:hypothetical protein [Wolbachia endosymbiont (group A) of Epistrophe grossularia]